MDPLFLSGSPQRTTFPRDENRLIFSSLREFHHVEDDAGLSIKYVLEGDEHYTLDGRTYRVAAGQFLVVNRGRHYEVRLSRTRPVEGVCVYLQPYVVADVLRTMTHSDEALLDDPNTSAPTPDFFEHVFSDLEMPIGARLRELARAASSRTEACATGPDLYHTLAADLVRSQYEIRREVARIPAAKPSTRAELYRRIRTARSFIDAECTNGITLDDVADAAALSPSHLIRTFREAFGRSPYDYVLERRIAFAAALLRESGNSVTEIAHRAGFADLPSFTKAFKRRLGCPPSELSSRNEP